jgi:hypothetical protein
MASRISNRALRDKAFVFIQGDPAAQPYKMLVQNALITANRQICDLDTVPLAWLREHYNELFTRPYANISAITEASPCVVTAASSDSGVTGHGFEDDDIVMIDGVIGMDQLNRRLLRVDAINATTLGLYQLNDQVAIDSSGYDAYTSGGKIYHCGIKIPHATIEPDEDAADYNWTIKRVFAVTFDLKPSTPIPNEVVTSDARYLASIGKPDRWRYERYGYTQLDSGCEHYLIFNRPADCRYNIAVHIEKTYPDLATWTTGAYPPHPPEIHDCVWRRALANLATNAERQQRQAKSGERLNTSVEILYAQFWQQEALKDEKFIKDFSRNLIGAQPAQGRSVRFNNPGLVRGR